MKRPSQEMISRLVLTLSGLLLAGFVLENFHIRNARLLGGNWDEGNLWFLLSKASMGLIPNVDFVSGYPGGV